MPYIGESWPDLLSLVSPAPRAEDPATTWVETSPDILYPATLRYLVNRLNNPQVPMPPLAELYYRAKAVNMSLDHLNMFEQTNPQLMQPLERHIRYEVLETCRLYFTEMLVQAIGGPTGIHIVRNPLYRL